MLALLVAGTEAFAAVKDGILVQPETYQAVQPKTQASYAFSGTGIAARIPKI